MSYTVFNSTGGNFDTSNAMSPNTLTPAFDEASVEILHSRFKADGDSARRAIELIQSKREELASHVSSKFPQLDHDAASHLLGDLNLPAAWDRAFGIRPTQENQDLNTIPEQYRMDHPRTGSSISFPIQGPNVGPVMVGAYSDSGLNPHRPAVSNTNSVSGMARRHVKCKRVGCKGKIVYKTKRGLREHMIMKHHMQEDQARLQAEFAFGDRQFSGTLQVPPIPGMPFAPVEASQSTDNQDVMEQHYYMEEVGAQFPAMTSPVLTVNGDGMQQGGWAFTSNRSHLSPYSQQQNLPAAGPVTQARWMLNRDLQNTGRTMQTSEAENVIENRPSSFRRVSSIQMPNSNSQASFETFEPFDYTNVGEHTYIHDEPLSNFNRRRQ